MEKFLEIVKYVAIAFAVLATLSLGFLMYNSNSELGKKAIDKTNTMNAQMAESDITIYDGTTVSGSDVINAIRKFQNDYISIEVITGLDRSGTKYLYSSTESSGVVTMGSEIPFDIKNALDKTNSKYINPNGRFVGSVYRDANGNIAKIKFEQK